MRFYGQFEIPVDKFLYERYFTERSRPGIFVECGAHDGIMESSCKFFEETMKWKGYNFEPSPLTFEKLSRNRPKSTNLNLALSGQTGTAPFTTVTHRDFNRDHFGLGSLGHQTAAIKGLTEGGFSFSDIAVKTISWNDFVDQFKISSIDLMVLDVEGHEIDVLESMKERKALPKIMCVEFGHIGLDRLRKTMSELGYRYDTASYANAFFVHSS